MIKYGYRVNKTTGCSGIPNRSMIIYSIHIYIRIIQELLSKYSVEAMQCPTTLPTFIIIIDNYVLHINLV
jgi:hypothetical protein